jgi:enoyl-CoA hydratase
MNSDYVDIIVERPSDGIVIATLNRPARRNALSDQMFRDLARLQVDVEEDSSIRAGLDLDVATALTTMSATEFLTNQERWADSIAGFSRLGVPVIAAVNGSAAGAGFALALACDIRIAGTSARFNAAFVKVGLSAGDCGASWFLPRIVGLGRATEILLTGRFVEAREALSMGLVTDVVDDDSILDRAKEVAEAIRANSPFGMRMTKQVIVANTAAGSLEVALAIENRTQVLASRTSDMAEALAAFRERRAPEFTGS